jgi:hypothetical protein
MSRNLLLLIILMSATPLAAESVLDNQGLVMLAHAGYNERFLAELLQARECRFDTSVEGLVYPAKQGISEKLVRAVLAREREGNVREHKHHEAAGASQHQPFDPPPVRVRLRVVEHKVLVPAEPGVRLGPNPSIVVERGLFGDRYYAIVPARAEPLTIASRGHR